MIRCLVLPSRCMCVALIALFACGCDDELCALGTTDCISESLIRTCVEGEDENVWFVAPCGDREVCVEDFAGLRGASPMGPDAGSEEPAAASATPSDVGDVCVGSCSIGESECVSDGLARYCIAGGVWQLDMCALGEQCVSGHCVLSDADGAVQRCSPGSTACAGETVEKVCDPDGTAWVFQACAANETCMDTECGPDLASSCDDGNVCLDSKTAIRCIGEGEGFAVVDCEGDTYCEAGRCRGATCAIGSTCNGTVNGMAQVRECLDGTNLQDSSCAAGEVCRQRKDEAECAPAACTPAAPGSTVCGDPEDSSADETRSFTTCMVGANSGVPEWVHGECIGQTVCAAAVVVTGNPCRQECTDEAQICASTTEGINDGYRRCDEGEWGPVERCNPDAHEVRLTCAVKPDQAASEVPEIVCAEPVCALVYASADTVEGTCDGRQIRRCNGDGTLAEAEDCEEGICREAGGGVQADGRLPGACDVDAECQEGEQRCIDDGSSATPRFHSCDDGVWSPILETCEDDMLCYDFTDVEGQRRKLCDAECSPGTRRCQSNGVQTCDAKGNWSDTQDCNAGVCASLGNQDAACVLPCTPGSKRCVGDSSTGPDGVHVGTDEQQVCGDDGTWDDAADCGASEVCRVGRLGEPIGCVECVGSDVLGGNEDGYVDTRCDGSDATQACGDDATWEDSVDCAGSANCVGPQPANCGSCTGPDGTTMLAVCTNSAWQGVEAQCAPCPTASDAAGLACTTMNIAANSTANGDKTTCLDAGAGDSDGAWAGHDDCCVDSQRTYGDIGTSCPNGPFAGEDDCCVMAQSGAAGPAFAYCGN